ncbi:MAG: hypothetical protein QMD85_01505 [Candidatus Aenigmarchaeota archaeon]|nr:hypothetical protein [Candidatus Aenigmarchaeota archaeon]MDI6722215.1 hypothetical protein [Candidatus Aenigmarchaeota archaeon]
MRRSLPSNKPERLNRRCTVKGQWFIISAVIISSVFLMISSMLRVSADIDASVLGRRSEIFYFENVKEQVKNVEAGWKDDNRDCVAEADARERDMKEFEYFSRQAVESRGYFFFMNYTINECLVESMGLMIASQDATFYQNVDPNELVPGII